MERFKVYPQSIEASTRSSKPIRSIEASDTYSGSLGQKFIKECKPYEFRILNEDVDSYQIVGIVGPMETYSELIQLVEMICENWGIDFYDAHIGQGDKGDFIIFRLPKD